MKPHRPWKSTLSKKFETKVMLQAFYVTIKTVEQYLFTYYSLQNWILTFEAFIL